MGCASSKETDRKATSTAIDMQLRHSAQTMSNEVKLLLLGAGESGKSTILKQMQLIHGVGYSDQERLAYKGVIFNNLVSSTVALYTGCTERLGLCPSRTSAFGRAVSIIYQAHTANLAVKYDSFPPELALAVSTLWNDPSMQSALSRSSEFQLNDSAYYYYSQLDRISSTSYLPTDQDILRTRIKTAGITETAFILNGITYRMFDVGGQRSERRKWIHCFDCVAAIIFLVALSEYDQVLIEDESVNRMHESLALFDSICNSRWFQDTAMILFLNKVDLFERKLLRSPLRHYFPDYTGPDADYDASCEYFLSRFVSLNRSVKKQVYSHFTCATDTTNIKFIFLSVRDIIMKNNLYDAGLM